MTAQEWLSSDAAVEKSRRSYAHFDYRTDLSRQRDYVSDPDKVCRHGFYPLIHYQLRERRYNAREGRSRKLRDICYAAHIDRCIYQYYSFLLGELYQSRVTREGMARTAAAYRTDLHQNNIHFAKQAIDFIRQCGACYIMIGDFTGFFDHLDHQYLKRQWCSLLDLPQLPEDHYKVFRSLTAYSTWELSDLLALNRLADTRKNRRILNGRARVLTPEQFRENRSHIQKNQEPFGIPQGTPISGTLANIYMLETDRAVHAFASALKGLYIRYSDDFILILPDTGSDTPQRLREAAGLFRAPGLILEPRKTQYFRYAEQTLINCGDLFGVPEAGRKRFLNYLGFTFDGKTVSIRSKTTGKYYRRMYRKAQNIQKSLWYTPKKNHISCQNLYGSYSVHGARGCVIKGPGGRLRRQEGNYLSYVQRADRIFGGRESIKRDTWNHMAKIRKALKTPVYPFVPPKKKTDGSGSGA